MDSPGGVGPTARLPQPALAMIAATIQARVRDMGQSFHEAPESFNASDGR